MIEEKEKYIDPFTDFGFKKLFGTEMNKDLLMDFLNELLRDEGKIVELHYLNPLQLGRSEADRNAVYDIHCKTEKGEYFIVEMQKVKQDFFKDRSVFYASFPIQEQGLKGEWDYQLKAVYTVGVLNFEFNESKADKNYYHSEVKLMDTKKKTVFYDKLTFIYLEMPKFNKTLEELETRFDKWLYVLKNLHKLQELPQKLQERIFKKIFKIAEIAKLDPIEYAEYKHSQKRLRDLDSAMKSAERKGEKKGLAKGEAKGLAKGKAEGLAEGEAKGLVEGEKNAKIGIAKKMLSKGNDIEEIADMTGLSIAEIKAL